MTAGQKAILWWMIAAACFAIGWVYIQWANSNGLSEGWGLVGGVIWLASFPAAIVGLYWLIRAAVHPDR